MQAVEHYYNERADQEWQRLEHHRTELAVTLRALAEFLPPSPAGILDIGGGPGRYAIALAQRGYSVTLADLSLQNLALARQQATTAQVHLADLVHANVLDLAMFGSETYDAVLLMGPLYHLTAEAERQQAVQEALRLLKPEGTWFSAFITRFAPFRNAAKYTPMKLNDRHAEAEQILATGIDNSELSHTQWYFAHPTEVQPFMEQCGLETLQIIGCEGVVSGIEEQVNQLDGDAWETWVDLSYRLGKDPSLHGAADHLLYVGRKRR